MALNGVNAPLAMVGQDAIWLDVFVADFVRAGQALSHRHSVNAKTLTVTTAPPHPPQRRGPCHVQQCSSLELVGSKVNPFMLTTVRDSDDLTLQGLDQDELLDNFFASPACQPWHWMGNLNGYRGSPCHGTSLGFIQRQLALQKRIVARQVALGTEALSRRHFGNSTNPDGGTTPTLERGCSAPPSGSSRVGSKGLLTLFTRVFTIGMPSQV